LQILELTIDTGADYEQQRTIAGDHSTSARRQDADRTPTHFREEPETLEKIYRRVGMRDYDRLLDYLDADIVRLPLSCCFIMKSYSGYRR